MKNIIKKNNEIRDAMAEARKYKKFQELSNDVQLRLRLAVEIYKKREIMGLRQQDLARKIGSTQKVISKLENGDVNVGIGLVNRIASALNFTVDNWSKIYNFTVAEVKIIWAVNPNSSGSQLLAEPREAKKTNSSNNFSFNQ